MNNNTLTPAREAFNAAGDKYQQMQAEADRAAAEVDRLASMTGDELLDSPERAEEIAAERSKAEHLAKLRAEMAQAAKKRWHGSVVPVLREEADALQPEIEAARKAVEQWHTKEQRLLAQLVEHTGVHYKREEIETQYTNFGYGTGSGDGGSNTLLRTARAAAPSPRQEAVEEALARLQAQQAALLTGAQGGEPLDVCRIEWLPDALLSDGVLCTDRTRRALAQEEVKRSAAGERARQRETDRVRVAELAQRFGIRTPELPPAQARIGAGGMAPGWADAIKREAPSWTFGRVSDEDLNAVCELAHIVGQRAAEEALKKLRAAANHAEGEGI